MHFWKGEDISKLTMHISCIRQGDLKVIYNFILKKLINFSFLRIFQIHYYTVQCVNGQFHNIKVGIL